MLDIFLNLFWTAVEFRVLYVFRNFLNLIKCWVFSKYVKLIKVRDSSLLSENNNNTKKEIKEVDVYAIDVSTKLSELKLVHLMWLIGLYDHLRKKPKKIERGNELA